MLEPITAAIALGGAAYNLYAGMENAKYQEGVLNKKRSLDNRMKQFKMEQVDQNFLKGMTDIQKQSGNALAGLAQGGNVGAGAQAFASANATDATTTLEEWKSNALKEIAFSSESADINYTTALDQINAGVQQKWSNAFFDMAGAGLSLGASAVDAGVFDFMMKKPDSGSFGDSWSLSDNFSGRVSYGSNASQVSRAKFGNLTKVAQ